MKEGGIMDFTKDASTVMGTPTKSMTQRIMAIGLIIAIVGFGWAGFGLLFQSIIKGPGYAAKAADQQLTTVSLTAKRGTIYDCKGEILATSATVWTVYITPMDIDKDNSESDEQARLISDGLSEILGVEREKIYEMTQKNASYVRVKTKVEENVAKKVREFISENSLGGIIGLEESSKRYYPNGSLASTVIGFVGDDNQGLAGIEYQYESVLQGIPGKLVASKNALGSDMPFNYETMVEAEQGKSLVLTIDEYVQGVAEKYLEEAVVSNAATNRGCCIIMNVNTGEILAMATKQDFDPNDPFTIKDQTILDQIAELPEEEQKDAKSKKIEELWKNKAITETYEPGSVFKIITGSAAMEEGKATENSTFDCPGYIVISGTRYNCHKHEGHGHQNMTNIFENSCNPAFIEIGQRLGAKTFYKYFKSYGFTKKTGIDLPGEMEAIYYTDKNMGPVELASESFGQTFRVTPIQLITAVAASCNGGRYIIPHVVKEIKDNNGNTIETIEPTVVHQVISEKTSKAICDMLFSTVNNGSGKNAYVAGYRMCGKTGTSQKIDKKDSTDKIASFCGFAPAEKPEYAILVMIDEPHGSSYYGSAVASPVAGSIMGEVLPYLGVEAIYTDDEYNSLNITVPNVVGMDIERASSTLTNGKLDVRVVGNGDKVVRQAPAAGVSTPQGSKVVLYTEEEETSKVTVPDFSSMSVSGVESTAKGAGLNVVISGVADGASGAISYKQSVKAGEEVEAGTVITVWFRYADSVE